MSTSTRRRRILNDGVRAAGAEVESSTPSAESADVSRYAANEDSVSFAVARRVLPHRRRAILGVTVAGLASVATLLAGHHFQAKIVEAIGVGHVPAIDLLSEQSIAAWATSIGLVIVAGLCLLVFGLRRHRSDDVRGVYRWWFSASATAMACSLCVATGFHQSLAGVAAAKTGWSPLSGDTFWWLAPVLLVVGSVVVRTVLDLKHCVPALLAALTSLASLATLTIAEWGGLPQAVTPWSTMIAHGAALLGILLAVVSLLCYSRRIVLEADGAIKAPVQKPTPKVEKQEAKPTVQATKSTAKQTAAKTSKPSPRIAASTTAASTKPTPKPKRAEAAKPATTTQWTDGSDADGDYGDDGDGTRRKLSKAERKRLRKLKARQNRAA